MYRIIIAGSRGFEDYECLKKHVEECLTSAPDRLQGKEIVIVSGAAHGTDALGERYAAEKGYKVERFPADWRKHGIRAGVIRNKEMAEIADALIPFWDGKSKGTANMIEVATRKKLHIFPVCYFRNR